MITQNIGGKRVNTVMASGTSADMLALTSLLEGEVTVYDLKAEGGITAPAPAILNTKKFSVGKKYLTGQRRSASVNIPHMKETVSFAEIQTAVIGQFDEDFEGSAKCTYSNLFYDKIGA